jgi:hypothetical protein
MSIKISDILSQYDYDLDLPLSGGTLTGNLTIKGMVSATGGIFGDGSGLTGSNKTIAFFTALNNEPPATNFATLDTRNSHPVLDFDTTTQEAAKFRNIIPEGVSLLSGVNVIAQWAASTATTGTIGWDVAFERIASNGIDIDADSFGTARTITAITVPSTAGITLTSSCSFTQAQLPSGLTNGNMYRLRIRRDVANDSASGDAELLGVEVRILF